jgi:hypothetical protein
MNLKPIFEKVLAQEKLADDERAYLLDWAARADSLTIGTNPVTGQITVQSVGPTQPEIAAMVDQALLSRVLVQNLSAISNQMGLQIAGEFRSGNGKVPGDGFTGGRFGWPGFSYGSDTWFLAGVLNDVLQVGLSLTDGKIYAGGGTVVISSSGIDISVAGVHKTSIQSDGDFFIGSNIDAAATTTLAIFTTAQTYNSESVGAGNLLIGDNSTNKPNVRYNASSGRLEFRLGTTVTIIQDTEGALTFSNNVTGLSFLATDPLKTAYLKMTNANEFWMRNSVAGGKLYFSINLTDTSTPAMTWSEDASNTNGTVLVIPAGTSGGAITLGSGVTIWTTKDGKETVFNEDSYDIDFRIESATHTAAFKLDAGGEFIQIFGGDLATFDNSSEHRLEIGADHYFPTRNSSDKTVYINEANQDIDTKIRSVNSDDTFIVDAGLDQAQFGAALALTGDITPSVISAQQNNYNPTGLSTANVLKLEASGSTQSITGIAGGADGRILILQNVGATYSLSLLNESGSSTDVNRFKLGQTSAVSIQPGYSFILIYDSTTQRWRPLSISAAALQGAPIDGALKSSLNSGDTIRWNSVSGYFEHWPPYDDTEGDPAAIGTAADGTSTYSARRDHVHAGSYTALSSLPAAETNANDIFACVTPGGVSLWTGTISGTPSGTSVTVSAPTSGTEAVLVPVSTSQLAKMRLYNLTRGNSALISNYNTGTNVVTLTATVPGSWANGDSLTVVSQTVSGGGRNWIDLELTSGPTGKSFLFVSLAFSSATAGDTLRLHPFSASFSASKFIAADAIAASTTINTNVFGLFNLLSNVISISWTGTPANIFIRESGFLQ